MELIVKSLICALFVGALGVVIYVQRTSLIAEQARAERAESDVSERDDTIKTLKQIDSKNRKLIGTLQATQTGIAATLSEREILIEKLQHDNITIRTWSESPLPDAIAGMRERPAITGADAYRQRLPASDTVQPASDSAQD